MIMINRPDIRNNPKTIAYITIEWILFLVVSIAGFCTKTLGSMTIVYLLLSIGHIYWNAGIYILLHTTLTSLVYIAALLINPDIIFRHTDAPSFIIGAVVFFVGSAGIAVYGHIIFRTRTTEHREKSRLASLLSSSETKNKMLEESALGKSNFFANLSHDIRTSVNTICGMSELLSQQQNTSSLENEYISTLQTAAHTLLNTVTDILDYSEIDAGRLELLHMKYNLFSCLKEIQNTVMLQLGNGNISFLIHINPSMPYQFYGDETRIRQVLMTLLNNSVSCTKCGHITMDVDYEKVDEEYGTIIIKVSDTGYHSDEEQHALPDAADVRNNTAEENNSDLTLLVARKLARLMDGNLTCETTPNKGTSFVFTIRQQIFTGFPLTEHASYEHCHILVHEPNDYYAHAIRQMLEELQAPYTFYETPDELSDASVDEENTYIFFDYASGHDILMSKLGNMSKTTVTALIDINTTPEEAHEACNIHFLPKPLCFFSLVPILDKKLSAKTGRKKKSSNNFIAPEARILIVDDNRVNLRVAKGLIATFQCDITTVTSGREAIDLIEHGEIYDLIFMDHMMPDLDGIETTKIIRDMPTPYAQQVPIIALTANTINGARELFIENEMNDFLPKPIEMNRLNEIMAEFIDTDRQIPVTEEPAK